MSGGVNRTIPNSTGGLNVTNVTVLGGFPSGFSEGKNSDPFGTNGTVLRGVSFRVPFGRICSGLCQKSRH